MIPFRCTGCGAPSVQATTCEACGGRTFGLSRKLLATIASGQEPAPLGVLLSIADAPSLRRERAARDARA